MYQVFVQLLFHKYGEKGSPARKEFEANAFYICEVLGKYWEK